LSKQCYDTLATKT